MKYLKTYENSFTMPSESKFTPRYRIIKGGNNIMVKIIDYDKYDQNLPFYVEFVDGEVSWFPGNKFDRDMTDDEIKEFEEKLELIKTAKKYNL